MHTDQQPRWIGGVEPAPELLHATGVGIMELECRQQPERLRALLSAYSTDPAIRRELDGLRALAAAPGPVLFLGMGGSLCSSYSGSVGLHAEGRPAFSLDAGEWLHYGTSTWDQSPLSILLTTSGESAELVELMKAAGPRPLALLCNNEASPCWRMAHRRLPILAGPEYGNATKTYTNAAAGRLHRGRRDPRPKLARRCRDRRRRVRRVARSRLCPARRTGGLLPRRRQYRNHRPGRGLRRRCHECVVHSRASPDIAPRPTPAPVSAMAPTSTRTPLTWL